LHVLISIKILQFHGLVTDSFVSVKTMFLSDLDNGKQNLITLFIVLNQSGSQLYSFMKEELHLVL